MRRWLRPQALEAVKAAKAARAIAEEKAAKAAKAVAAAKSSLELVATLYDEGTSRDKHLERNQMKKHIPVQILYNKSKGADNFRTDDELAWTLHRAINSFSRDGTVPCITLIFGGNLTQGLRKAQVKPSTIIAVVSVRFIVSPLIGIGLVKAADNFGFLPADPLYHFVLMLQYTVPPAMNIGTMTQLM